MRKCPLLPALFLLTFSLFGQEYWKDFFFFNDPQSFDQSPYMGMELSGGQARASGTYTEVLYEEGKMEEALSYVNSDPEYLYRFFYNTQDAIQFRISYYIDDFMELYPMTELFYHYDTEGLYVVTLLEYDLFDRKIRSRQYIKKRTGGRLKTLNEFEMSRSEELLQQLNEEEEILRAQIPETASILLLESP